MMDPEEYKWTIEIIQHRYGIPLTFEQAEKVYQYEQEKDIDSWPQHFSYWEEYEYELDSFEKILTSEQFKTFKESRIAALRSLEEQIVKGDELQIQQVNYHRVILDFLSGSYHPAFYKKKSLFSLLQQPDLKSKVEFLKAEYKKYLALSLKEAIISHYRHNRLLAPNLIEVTRLRNKIRHVTPEYGAFYYRLDEPSKAIADYVDKKIKSLPEYDEPFLHARHKQLYEFYQELNAKYFATPLQCSHVRYEPSPERPIESWSMELVLMDEKMYDIKFKNRG